MSKKITNLFSARTWNTIGLASGLTGTLIVFYYGLPSIDLLNDGAVFEIEITEKMMRSIIISRAGLFLIAVGFISQFLSNSDTKEITSGSFPQRNESEHKLPELTAEENQLEAELTQKVHVLCRLAESHLEHLDDEYENNALKERIAKAFKIAKGIRDPFYFSVSLHPIIVLAHRAGFSDLKDEMLALVSDPVIKEKIIKDLHE